VEGEYLAPDRSNPASGRNWRAAGGTAVGLAVLFAKFKGLLFALLSLKWLLFAGKFALTGFSFLASIWFYALYFGWKFAIVFVLLIAVHELGHAIFVRAYGLAMPGIYFVPGFGAFTTWRGGTQSVYQEAVIAFGGPLLGTIGGVVCLLYGLATNEPFWTAAAYTAFFLNLINMVPLAFFDGGRITGVLSPNFWIAGFVIVIVAAIAFHWWSPILFLVVLLSLPRMISAWRGELDPRYAAVPPSQKASIGIAYFGLLAVLLACLVISKTGVPGYLPSYQ
jgi:Zn-dependent protease